MTIPIWLFAVSWIVLALQYVPVIGPILMILGASVWPVITINLAFFGLAKAALFEKEYRAWIILPVLYFGGNIILAGVSEFRFLQLSHEIEAENAGQVFALSEVDALVVDTRTSTATGLPSALVRNFAVAKVYEQPNSTGADINAWKIGTDPLCSKLRTDRGGNAGHTISYELQENDKRVQGMCVYHFAENPTGRIATLTVTNPIEHESFFLPYKTQIITIADDTGKTARLRYAEATPLTWIPMLAGGCFYGEGRHAPTCFFGPLRIFSMPALGSAKDAATLVARALNLEWKPASRRRGEISLQDMNSDLRPSTSF